MDTNDLRSIVPFIKDAFNLPRLYKLIYHSKWCTSSSCGRPLIEKLISHRLSLAIELAYEFVISSKRAKFLLENVLEEWNGNYLAVQQARYRATAELDDIVKEIRSLWLNSREKYHDILQQIQTRRAIARLLHLEDNILVKMYNSGMLNENEKARFQKEIEDKLVMLHNVQLMDHFKNFPTSSPQELAKTMLLVQSFLPQQMTVQEQSNIVKGIRPEKYEENEYIFRVGDKNPCIVLITPPMSLAAVELRDLEIAYDLDETVESEEGLVHVHPGEIFAYDFLCNEEFSISLKAITDVNVYKITRQNLEDIYQGQEKGEVQVLKR